MYNYDSFTNFHYNFTCHFRFWYIDVVNEEQWLLEKEKEANSLGLRKDIYGTHYASTDDQQSVALLRMTEDLAWRVLDFTDCLDLWKIWARTCLFQHEVFGLSVSKSRERTHPLRWIKPMKADDDSIYGNFRGKSLKFPRGSGKNSVQ